MGYKIAVIGGDGTGPEVIREAVKVLKVVDQKHNIGIALTDLPYDGTRYLETGKTLEDDELEGLKSFDAILLGAIGHPDIKPGILEREILLKMRFGLDQYINLRPVKLYPNVKTPLNTVNPADIDYVVVRENTGGLYTGNGGLSMKGTQHEVATQTMVYNYAQVKRCVRYAFETAMNRHKTTPWKGLSEEDIQNGFIGKLTLCGKSNVLTYVFDLWQRVLKEVSADFPKIKTDYCHVDAMCIYMLECPQNFDVIVTTNMFGDIITDLAAVTQGGMGVASSGNINPNGVSMFEPIGGTAPAFTGKNEINPLAAIGAVRLMLMHLGHEAAAIEIESAMAKAILKMKSMAAGKMGMGTSDVGDLVANDILRS